jgi:hypothetical protein
MLLIGTAAAHAQWQILDSGTTADLRGIDNAGNGVAWASGTNGTVVRTTDDGATWTHCATPPDAANLDFRGIQAFDTQTAIVMSSGKGDLSRLYKTVDGCKSWKLLFTNPDAPEGFWDAVVARVIEASPGEQCGAGSKWIIGTILGDPAVHKSNQWDTTKSPSFYLANFIIGITCSHEELKPSVSSIFSLPGETAFAASNSVLARLDPYTIYWMAVGKRQIQYSAGMTVPSHYETASFCDIGIPISHHSESSGLFSLAIRQDSVGLPKPTKIGGFDWKKPSCQKADMVVVGGDYTAINERQDTAAYTGGSSKFKLSETPPGGYRSAVAYDPATKTWITVGPNGTDISTDDGRNWRAVHPNPALNEPPDADRNWNALSLPFVVGPHGRIGKLDPDAIQKPDNSK